MRVTDKITGFEVRLTDKISDLIKKMSQQNTNNATFQLRVYQVFGAFGATVLTSIGFAYRERIKSLIW